MITRTAHKLRDAVAPDGSDVRVLVSCDRASMAHFELPPCQTSVAVGHRTLEEMWYFLSGRGEMWRRSERTGDEETVVVHAGVALTIPSHTFFQFRSMNDEPLTAVGVTLPAWPGIGDMDGTGEVILVEGPWRPTVTSGMGVTR